MVPVIASSGSSFRGAFDYYCHDKGAQTAARVAWTQTVNILTDCTEKAWKVMAYTAKHAAELKRAAGIAATGKKPTHPVFAYSLSWHPEQSPSKDDMIAAAHDSLERLGLAEHQSMIAAHNDEPQPHIHIVVNKVHPLSGKSANLKFSKRVLSDFAREHEIKDGKVYCERRVENHEKRERGEPTKHGDPVLVSAWKRSKDGKEFSDLLRAEGYELAKGRKRIVVIDPYGKALNPVRLLPGIKAKDFRERVSDLDPQSLQTPEQIIKQRSDESTKKSIQPDDATPAKNRDDRYTQLEDQTASLKERYRKASRAKLKELKTFYQIAEKNARYKTLNAKLKSQNPFERTIRNWLGLNRKLYEQVSDAKTDFVQARNSMRENFAAVMRHQNRDLKRSISHLENVNTPSKAHSRSEVGRGKKSVTTEFSRAVQHQEHSENSRSKPRARGQNDGPSISR